jgi:hypothetical protein
METVGRDTHSDEDEVEKELLRGDFCVLVKEMLTMRRIRVKLWVNHCMVQAHRVSRGELKGKPHLVLSSSFFSFGFWWLLKVLSLFYVSRDTIVLHPLSLFFPFSLSLSHVRSVLWFQTDSPPLSLSASLLLGIKRGRERESWVQEGRRARGQTG